MISRRKISAMTVILWVIAAMFAIYTVWAAVMSVISVVDLVVTQGAVIPTDITYYDIVNFIFTQCGASLFYTVVLAVAGVFFMKKTDASCPILDSLADQDMECDGNCAECADPCDDAQIDEPQEEAEAPAEADPPQE